MAAVANNPGFAKKAGVKQSVGQDFVSADKGRKFGKGGLKAGINNPDTSHGKLDMPNFKAPAKFAKGGKIPGFADGGYDWRKDSALSTLASLGGEEAPEEEEEAPAPRPRRRERAAASRTPTPPRATAPAAAPRPAAPAPTLATPRPAAPATALPGAAADAQSKANALALEQAEKAKVQQHAQHLRDMLDYSDYLKSNNYFRGSGTQRPANADPSMLQEAAKRYHMTSYADPLGGDTLSGIDTPNSENPDTARFQKRFEIIKELAGLGDPRAQAEYNKILAEYERRRAAMSLNRMTGTLVGQKGNFIKPDEYTELDMLEGRSPARSTPNPRTRTMGLPTYAKGGSVTKGYAAMEKKHAAWMKSHGAPKKMVAEEEAEGNEEKGEKMACGGKVMKYAKGGGIERKGKTSTKMIRMASGGSVSSRADGIAKKGKTNCKYR